MKRFVPALLAITLLATIAMDRTAAAPTTKAPATLAPKKTGPSDPRLDQPVSVARRYVYLGELVEELARQSHVRLQVEQTKGPLDGVQLTAFLKGQPLREVMDGVAALLTYPHHRCLWDADKNGGYTLRHQPSFEAASAANRAEMLQQFAADVRAIHQLARQPDEQRVLGARNFPQVFGTSDPDKGITAGILDLLGSLKPDEVSDLLNGKRVNFNLAHASKRGRTALTLNMNPPPALDPNDPPHFQIDWSPAFLGPVLWLNVGGGGINTIGGRGWGNGWLEKEGDGWRTGQAPEVQELIRLMGKHDPEAGTPGPVDVLPGWIKRAARQQELNILADRVYPRRADTMSTWAGKTPRQTLCEMVSIGNLAWKESGQIHLLRHVSASAHPRDHLLTWARLKALRQQVDAATADTILPALTLLSALTPAQSAGLEEEFPGVALVKDFRAILAFYTRLREEDRIRLRSEEGLRFADAGVEAQNTLLADPDVNGYHGIASIRKDPAHAYISLRVEHVRRRVRVPVSQASAKPAASPGGTPAPPAAPARAVPSAPGARFEFVERDVAELAWNVRVPDARPSQARTRLEPRIRVEEEKD